ncbi:hypothetical protein AA0522_2126 [Gluconacetobacter liquefaciens NRIC 0522]|nr:hypothetical protein AA0522_2126 [Gluconacetobacter liquefaciens NRIC 0522]
MENGKLIKSLKYLGWRRYALHLVAKALLLHAKIENGQPIGVRKSLNNSELGADHFFDPSHDGKDQDQ